MGKIIYANCRLLGKILNKITFLIKKRDKLKKKFDKQLLII